MDRSRGKIHVLILPSAWVCLSLAVAERQQSHILQMLVDGNCRAAIGTNQPLRMSFNLYL